MKPNFKFNWGAFALTPIFGFATKSWLCLLSLIPPLTLPMGILAGFYAPKWAYESGYFSTVEEFNAVMDTWNRAGKYMIITTLIALIPVFLLVIFVFGITMSSANFFSELPSYTQELVKFTTLL